MKRNFNEFEIPDFIEFVITSYFLGTQLTCYKEMFTLPMVIIIIIILRQSLAKIYLMTTEATNEKHNNYFYFEEVKYLGHMGEVIDPLLNTQISFLVRFSSTKEVALIPGKCVSCISVRTCHSHWSSCYLFCCGCVSFPQGIIQKNTII